MPKDDAIARILVHHAIKLPEPCTSLSQNDIYNFFKADLRGDPIQQELFIEEAAATVDFKIGRIIIEFNGPITIASTKRVSFIQPLTKTLEWLV